MIGGFRSVLCVSVFQGSLLVIVIMIDGSEKLLRRLLNLRDRVFFKSAVKEDVLKSSDVKVVLSLSRLLITSLA